MALFFPLQSKKYYNINHKFLSWKKHLLSQDVNIGAREGLKKKNNFQKVNFDLNH